MAEKPSIICVSDEETSEDEIETEPFPCPTCSELLTPRTLVEHTSNCPPVRDEVVMLRNVDGKVTSAVEYYPGGYGKPDNTDVHLGPHTPPAESGPACKKCKHHHTRFLKFKAEGKPVFECLCTDTKSCLFCEHCTLTLPKNFRCGFSYSKCDPNCEMCEACKCR